MARSGGVIAKFRLFSGTEKTYRRSEKSGMELTIKKVYTCCETCNGMPLSLILTTRVTDSTEEEVRKTSWLSVITPVVSLIRNTLESSPIAKTIAPLSPVSASTADTVRTTSPTTAPSTISAVYGGRAMGALSLMSSSTITMDTVRLRCGSPPSVAVTMTRTDGDPEVRGSRSSGTLFLRTPSLLIANLESLTVKLKRAFVPLSASSKSSTTSKSISSMKMKEVLPRYTGSLSLMSTRKMVRVWLEESVASETCTTIV